MIPLSLLLADARKSGLLILSSTSRNQVERILREHASYLEDWQMKGYAADMAYMQRPPDLLCDPSKLLPEYQSIITFLVPYNTFPHARIDEKSGFGKVARYAWGNDYHLVIKERLSRFLLDCENKKILNRENTRFFTDSVPLLERALAANAELGFIGKSSMLIRPGSGTYFFIAEMITSEDILNDINSEIKIRDRSCGGCQSCIDECPTSAIVKDKVVDARKCISYLTIEKRGIFTIEEIRQVGSWVFGCDVCQEVCPFNNKKSFRTQLLESDFLRSDMHGPYLDIGQILEIRNDKEFFSLFSRSAIRRTKRDGLLRNAMSVAFNQKDFSHIDKIIEIMKEDTSDMLRSQSKIILSHMLEYADGTIRRKIKNTLVM